MKIIYDNKLELANFFIFFSIVLLIYYNYVNKHLLYIPFSLKTAKKKMSFIRYILTLFIGISTFDRNKTIVCLYVILDFLHCTGFTITHKEVVSYVET